jgi:hypothetical protein
MARVLRSYEVIEHTEQVALQICGCELVQTQGFDSGADATSATRNANHPEPRVARSPEAARLDVAYVSRRVDRVFQVLTIACATTTILRSKSNGAKSVGLKSQLILKAKASSTDVSPSGRLGTSRRTFQPGL